MLFFSNRKIILIGNYEKQVFQIISIIINYFYVYLDYYYIFINDYSLLKVILFEVNKIFKEKQNFSFKYLM